MSQIVTSTNNFFMFWGLVRRSLRGEAYDYTKGSIRHAIILLAIPMILELSLESVFAVVDMFFVGRLGKNAIATVGLTESVVSIVYSIAIGLSTAATALVARRTGAKDQDGAAHAAAQTMMFSIAIAVIISIAGLVFAPQILKLMGASAQVIEEGVPFTRMMLGGSVVIILIFLINGIFRGAGNAAMAMRSLWIASFANIVLCPLLIYGAGFIPGFGLFGAALATTIGRGIGVCYQCFHLFKGSGSIQIKSRHFGFDWPLMKSIAGISSPATLQFLIASGSWIILAAIVAHTGGTTATAGYQVALRNLVFFILPSWGLSNAAATLVGQNLGARQPERAHESVLLTAKYNAVFMSAVTLLFLLFAEPIIGIFTNDVDVRQTGTEALRIIGTGYIFYGVGMVMMQALNGAGDTKTPTLINLFGFWIFQVPFAIMLAEWFNMGATGSFISIPAAEILISIAAWVFFKKEDGKPWWYKNLLF